MTDTGDKILPAPGALAASRDRSALVRAAANLGIQTARESGTAESKKETIAVELAVIEKTASADDVALAREVALAALEEESRAAEEPKELFKKKVRRAVGAQGVTTENFSGLVKTGVAAAQTFLKDGASGAEKKQAVTDVMTDLIDWSVREEKLSLTAEIGSVLKPLLAQSIEVAYQLLSGQDPDFAAFVTEKENREALVKGAGLLRRGLKRIRCKCCAKQEE